MRRGSAFIFIGAVLVLLAGCADDAQLAADPPADSSDRADVAIANGQKGDLVNVGVVSWRDMPFQTVRRQQFDFSCGSAAVATLVSYAYGVRTSESDVFREMFARGDRRKITTEGFSMLDMVRYLREQGFDARGYKMSIAAAARYRVPFIALINYKGYNHFVVVKSIRGGRVLVGDPTLGSTDYSEQDFAALWNGVALIVVNKAKKARAAYADNREWGYARAHPLLRAGFDEAVNPEPPSAMAWQIAPTLIDMLPVTLAGATGSP